MREDRWTAESRRRHRIVGFVEIAAIRRGTRNLRFPGSPVHPVTQSLAACRCLNRGGDGRRGPIDPEIPTEDTTPVVFQNHGCGTPGAAHGSRRPGAMHGQARELRQDRKVATATTSCPVPWSAWPLFLIADQG